MTKERTWERPKAEPAARAAPPPPVGTAATTASIGGDPKAKQPRKDGAGAAAMEETISPGSSPQGRNLAGVQRRGAGTDWHAEEFKNRLEKARSTKDRNFIKSILKEVAENNYALRNQWAVPRTELVSAESCLKSRVTGMGTDPEITFSCMTTADALMFFGREPSRKVVGLNFANGQSVGGGYKNGAYAQEEDLCRRMPTLYTSLYNAKREGHYPFGPATCSSASPARYSDVLWTPKVCIARAGEERGFELLPKDQQANVSLVAAAAPNIKFADPPERYDKDLMLNTVKAVLLAPLNKQPETTTIVLGAWGCGAFGCDPYDIAELFVKALVEHRLGRLYREVHFAIPQFDVTDQNPTVFREIFRRKAVKFKEIEMTLGCNVGQAANLDFGLDSSTDLAQGALEDVQRCTCSRNGTKRLPTFYPEYEDENRFTHAGSSSSRFCGMAAGVPEVGFQLFTETKADKRQRAAIQVLAGAEVLQLLLQQVFERASLNGVAVESFYLQQQIQWEMDKYPSPHLSPTRKIFRACLGVFQCDSEANLALISSQLEDGSNGRGLSRIRRRCAKPSSNSEAEQDVKEFETEASAKFGHGQASVRMLGRALELLNIPLAPLAEVKEQLAVHARSTGFASAVVTMLDNRDACRLLLALCCSALAADVEKHQALSAVKAHAPDKEAGEVKAVKAPMPFGDLEPFGRQNAGQDLTESAISETNEMVGQLERAEVAEECISGTDAAARCGLGLL
ncbi:unnamed protein product [Symbiodinium necroappetens]|uniref:Microbial-type PARG catalytic domain-containing protein n=1 Tax=Symbiodinium necroappetens TaxID=1628268 RepID=A0A813CKI3_9DINO|nr:unnamed protein product [Symbiodinium necroappetens]